MATNLETVRAAVESAKIIAAEFHSGEAKFYEVGNVVPVLTTPCRIKKPKTAAFDASDATAWSTKRISIIKVPLNATTGIIKKGLIVQISTPDGDPTINHINFTVESSLGSQFTAERQVVVSTEVVETPRIV